MGFVGGPKFGMCSLLNPLLGHVRPIVSEVRGTTRDSIDTTIPWGRSEIVLIDTAGIRRRGKVASGPAAERYATLRALRAIERADVAVLVIDAVEGLTAQDAHVAGYIVEEGRGLVLAINKWDIVEGKTDRTFDQYVTWIRNEVPFLDFAPVVSISARTGQRVDKVLELAVDVWGERRRRIPTAALNRLLAQSTERWAPQPVRGRRPKLLYATQAAIAPPTFVFFASDASAIHFSYRRYLENRLREAFGFDGTPIRIIVRDRGAAKAPRREGRSSGGGGRRSRSSGVAGTAPGPAKRVAAGSSKSGARSKPSGRQPKGGQPKGGR
jgi:GTP-binding protein